VINWRDSLAIVKMCRAVIFAATYYQYSISSLYSNTDYGPLDGCLPFRKHNTKKVK